MPIDGFDRAQAAYDNAEPDYPEECPECDGAEYDADEDDCPHGFYRDWREEGDPYDPRI